MKLLAYVGLSTAALNKIAAGNGSKAEISQLIVENRKQYLYKYDVVVTHPVTRQSVHVWAYEYPDQYVSINDTYYLFTSLVVRFEDAPDSSFAFEWVHNPAASWYSIANGTLWPFASTPIGVERTLPDTTTPTFSIANVWLTQFDANFVGTGTALPKKQKVVISAAGDEVTCQRWSVGGHTYGEYPQYIIKYLGVYYVFMVLIDEATMTKAISSGWEEDDDLTSLYNRAQGKVNFTSEGAVLIGYPDNETGYDIHGFTTLTGQVISALVAPAVSVLTP